MEYRYLGRTGVRVSSLCLGAGMFGAWGNADVGACIRMIHTAIDAGINFFDTSDAYSEGESEEILGKAIADRRENLVIATKVFSPVGPDINNRGSSRRWITEEVENSMRRLGVDYIDLYQMHKPDPMTDIDETLGVLSDLIHQGKVRYVGTSSFMASQIVEAQWTAKERGRERFVTEQPPYSMLVRAVETEVLPTCQKYGLGVMCWSPAAGGWLSGKWHLGVDELTKQRSHVTPSRYDLTVPHNQRKLEATRRLAGVAADAGMTLPQMAIAFVRQHPAVTAAIIGPYIPEHLDEYLAGAEFTLDDAILDRIDQIVTPGTNFSWTDAGFRPSSITDPRARRRASGASER